MVNLTTFKLYDEVNWSVIGPVAAADAILPPSPASVQTNVSDENLFDYSLVFDSVNIIRFATVSSPPRKCIDTMPCGAFIFPADDNQYVGIILSEALRRKRHSVSHFHI
jgi:hypothetical protein